ncbi:MAG: NAD(P)H-dependent oxidoreductase subunit E [Nitrososphaeria archaeon]|nr:NAD(P)H-dependent oxidoreductase subunit E [Nitrososphaeria archaeon]NIN53511.1 NAD(P)H-dependent oxidoreductase subunit E [Nitrososphaeria archaeon]NIQ34022.1 NAD(P)H-dependent oxidoreductase subunit E [Nitrososphaeria archaeon]
MSPLKTETSVVDRSQLISALQDVQSRYGYIPEEEMIKISERFHVPLIDVYGIVTFYKSFSLIPRGRYTITVCLGTACHVRGGPRIADELGRRLGINPGETTGDNEFSLETVNCLGCCALGPVVVVRDQSLDLSIYYGQMTSTKIISLLKKYKKLQ